MAITQNVKYEINFLFVAFYKAFSHFLTIRDFHTHTHRILSVQNHLLLYLQPTHPNQILSSCKTVPPIASVSVSALYEWIPSRIPKKDFIYIIKLKQPLSLWEPTEMCCSTLSLFPVQRGWSVQKPTLPCWLWGVITSQWETMVSSLSLFSFFCTLYLCQSLPHGLWFSLTSSVCHTHILTRTLCHCDS